MLYIGLLYYIALHYIILLYTVFDDIILCVQFIINTALIEWYSQSTKRLNVGQRYEHDCVISYYDIMIVRSYM